MNNKWMVAPSYAHATIVKVDEENKKAYIRSVCDRCGGRGYYAIGTCNGQPVLSPVDGGVCYQCGGNGVIEKWVKAYTEKEYEQYMATRERSKQRKIDKQNERIKELENNSEINMRTKLADLGYDIDNPKVYVVIGVNFKTTYEIKDFLKENGCKFNPSLGWYNVKNFDLPEDYHFIIFPVFDLFDWNCYTCSLDIKDSAKETVKTAYHNFLAANTTPSEYVGELKERLRDLNVIVCGSRFIDSRYGTSTIYTFKYNDNILVWITSSSKYDLQIGDHLLLTGTVKDHKEYNGTKQTYLSRCLIK